MTAGVIVDAAGGRAGGAARFRVELIRYLARTQREDVRVIGAERRVDPAWLIRREVVVSAKKRRIALNNVSFVTPGGARWTLLRNHLDFLTEAEQKNLHPSLRTEVRRRAQIVHIAARRADVLVVPSTAMGDRVSHLLPSVASRVVVRPHPVSADAIPRLPRKQAILCPVLFSPYKEMPQRIEELLTAMDEALDPSVSLFVTAKPEEVPAHLLGHRRLEIIGHLDTSALAQLWARSKAIFFPSGIESFGYPLAEARTSGHPVIARATAQNREIADQALCEYTPGDRDSLRRATIMALSSEINPDPGPFDPDRYFEWLLGSPR
jgi:glycosyltransferase involved in cell wall biosynthesis